MGDLSTDMLVNAVSENDAVIGIVNRKELPLHPVNFRVVHIFVFDAEDRLLLQHIAEGNRSAGLWGSSVAGYVQANETYAKAAHRKALGELGASLPIQRVGKTAMMDLKGTKFLTLYEARHSGPFTLDPEQVSEVRFVPLAELREDMEKNPQRYTPTFRVAFSFFSTRRFH